MKDYALRWREVVAQVNPPLVEREYVQLFVNTFQGLYYERLCLSIRKSFSKMIMQGEMLENDLKTGKIMDPYAKTGEGFSNTVNKVATTRGTGKKEGEVLVILPTQPQQYYPQYQARP